jgi:hypothetical protein
MFEGDAASLTDEFLRVQKWRDQIALQSVRYYPNAKRSAYYIEVETGWIGKPDLKMPDEFWRGTGYDRSLKPAKLDEEQPVRVAGGEESRSTLSGYVEG